MRKLVFLLTIFLLLACSEEISSPYQKLHLPSLKIVSIIGINDILDLDDKVVITFNTNLGVKTIARAIECKSGNNRAVFRYSHTKKKSGDIVTLTPYYAYLPYVKYSCRVSTSLTDLYGAPLKEEYKFTFSTSDKIYSDKILKKENYPMHLVKRMIDTKCIDCHNSKHKLNFKVENLKELLIDKYVTPNNARESYLIRKLLGVDFNGRRMPIDKPLNLREIERIFGWIENLEQ